MMHLKLTLPSLTSIKKRKYFMYMLSNRVVCDRYFDAHAGPVSLDQMADLQQSR
jgi:hypothetical protein